MTTQQLARQTTPLALELRATADQLLKASYEGNGGRWAHQKAVKADQRYWQYIHGGGCMCWSCKGN